MLKRSAGILIPLFSIRTADDLGRGEIGGLGPMLRWALSMGHRMIQLLPIDETTPGEASPYSALSVFAIDPLYITLDGLAGIPAAALRRAHEELGGERSPPRDRMRLVKLGLLQRAYRWFRDKGDDAERARLAEFEHRNARWLDDYALFRALKEQFEWRAWQQWPAALRDREAEALAAARRKFGDASAMYRYWQFLADAQLGRIRAEFAAAGASLVGDLAFSPGLDSAEVWANQDQFDLSRLVGAPPDAFNPAGQRWGLPMPNWERMRAAGWSLLRARMRRARELYDLVRIDHVVGLYRTYNFSLDPDGPGCFTPADEADQRAQGDTILRALQQEAGTTALIAEDLGMIPSWVRESLRVLGVPGYKVLRWEREGQGNPGDPFIAPARYPELSLATSGTHDTETLAQWWQECGPHQRRVLLESLGIGERGAPNDEVLGEATLDAILEALYAAPSLLIIEPLQDLFGWTARINFPGTVGDDNWSWRLPAAIERLMENPAIAQRGAVLAAIASRSGRS
jgi:4-alpha-glucanotransferase